MLLNIIYVFLALLALSILVFIHEFGHYFMARKLGMRVEVFSIGFGRSIYSWMRRGVRWQLSILPFGGYVKIAGMEKEGNRELYEIEDGFYGKPPASRILVAIMGPFVNIVFALVLFTVIWTFGGRTKPFSEFTQIVGAMDPTSELYELGVRSGDQIIELGQKKYEGFRDLLYTGVFKESSIPIEGYKINYLTQEKDRFSYILTPYESRYTKGFNTIGITSPASYLLYDHAIPGSSAEESGIKMGDRILWVQGEIVFSVAQLSQLINEPKSLLTVKRDGKVFLTKIPRILIRDLRLNSAEWAELRDWQYENKIPGNLRDLTFVPYFLSRYGEVEREIPYLNENAEEILFSKKTMAHFEIPLKKGDKILAIDGVPLTHVFELFKAIQERRVVAIVQKNFSQGILSWKNEDERFFHSAKWEDLAKCIQRVGIGVSEEGDFKILKPIAIKSFGDNKKILSLGIALHDQNVVYNPNPLQLFSDVIAETGRTLKALFTGSLSPKWMTGPVGIVHVISKSYSLGIKEMLFWLAIISFNLGILNILPIPVLDGGHICFSLFETITKKRIKPKTMERLIIPFVVLFIAFFVYITYQDLLRIFWH